MYLDYENNFSTKDCIHIYCTVHSVRLVVRDNFLCKTLKPTSNLGVPVTPGSHDPRVHYFETFRAKREDGFWLGQTIWQQ